MGFVGAETKLVVECVTATVASTTLKRCTTTALTEYRLIGKKGEGTFSEVLKAQCIKNGKYVAIKCMKNHFDSLEQACKPYPVPSAQWAMLCAYAASSPQVNNLREIQALRRLSPHPGIIKLCEVLYDQPTGRLALVFELMDMNIYELIRGRRQYCWS